MLCHSTVSSQRVLQLKPRSHADPIGQHGRASRHTHLPQVVWARRDLSRRKACPHPCLVRWLKHRLHPK